jgi:holo-[acyl-carrier protein] synthase
VRGQDVEASVVASAFELVEIDEVEGLLAETGASVPAGESQGGSALAPFSGRELAFARSKSDPARRLAARLAAKRAAARALGDGIAPEDVEVLRDSYGPPRLRLSARAEERLRARGATRALVSLTHERRHAAAAVLLVRED